MDENMSRITHWFPDGGSGWRRDAWWGCVVESSRCLLLPGITGRSPAMKQQYPELLDLEDVDAGDRARLQTCHSSSSRSPATFDMTFAPRSPARHGAS